MRSDSATGRRSDEIEITPEMIEAGISALAVWDLSDDGALIVTSIFHAMLEAQQLLTSQLLPPHP